METITLNCVAVKHSAYCSRASHNAILRAPTVAAHRSSTPAAPLHIETVVDHGLDVERCGRGARSMRSHGWCSQYGIVRRPRAVRRVLDGDAVECDCFHRSD